jgi:hypothetical protein
VGHGGGRRASAETAQERETEGMSPEGGTWIASLSTVFMSPFIGPGYGYSAEPG